MVGQISLQDACGTTNKLTDVLHVPTITKNLISVGQMVEKGLQVKFNYKGCFIEDPKKGYKMIAKGKKEGRMFTMDITKDDRTCFAHGNEKIVEIDLWHKRIGHVNLQKLKSMQLNEFVFGLPHLKFFGCVCYVHVPQELRTKLDAKSGKCVLCWILTFAKRISML